MRRESFAILILAFLLATVSASCRRAAGQPDLVPVSQAPADVQFCATIGEQWSAVVTVKNQGNANAAASVTRVEFPATGTVVDVPTPAVNAGESRTLDPVPTPEGCFTPDCGFNITVDSEAKVTESNEGNNAASGRCIG